MASLNSKGVADIRKMFSEVVFKKEVTPGGLVKTLLLIPEKNYRGFTYLNTTPEAARESLAASYLSKFANYTATGAILYERGVL